MNKDKLHCPNCGANLIHKASHQITHEVRELYFRCPSCEQSHFGIFHVQSFIRKPETTHIEPLGLQTALLERRNRVLNRLTIQEEPDEPAPMKFNIHTPK